MKVLHYFGCYQFVFIDIHQLKHGKFQDTVKQHFHFAQSVIKIAIEIRHEANELFVTQTYCNIAKILKIAVILIAVR